MSKFKAGDKVVTHHDLARDGHPAFNGVNKHYLDAREPDAHGVVKGVWEPLAGTRDEELVVVDHTEPLGDGTIVTNLGELAVYREVELDFAPAGLKP